MSTVPTLHSSLDQMLKRIKGLQADVDNLSRTINGRGVSEGPSQGKDQTEATVDIGLFGLLERKQQFIISQLDRLELMIGRVQATIVPEMDRTSEAMAKALAPRPVPDRLGVPGPQSFKPEGFA